MKIQLWSYNYDPEPTGIAPLSRVVAVQLRERGHDVRVVAAHAHYPEPAWGTRVLPYRETRDGVSVYRLPLWIGRSTTAQRLRQEATYSAALAVASLGLETPDVIIAVSPSFPALAPTMVHARLRRVPWVLWLQDILPDGATATGMITQGRVLSAARRLELAAYRSAAEIVVISDSFRDNLLRKGVPNPKMTRIYNPASLPIREVERPAVNLDSTCVLTMGNIGHTQNLVAVVRAFEADRELTGMGGRLVLAGDGVAGDDVRAAVTTDRTSVTGIVSSKELNALLMKASLALVSQHYDGIDFNVPSKLMNFMGHGLATVAAVRADSEVARIIRQAGAGWVVDNPAEAAATAARVLRDPPELARRGRAALAFAQRHFAPERTAAEFEMVVDNVVSRSSSTHDT